MGFQEQQIKIGDFNSSTFTSNLPSSITTTTTVDELTFVPGGSTLTYTTGKGKTYPDGYVSADYAINTGGSSSASSGLPC